METTVSMTLKEYKNLKLKDLDAHKFKEKVKKQIELITDWEVIVDLQEYGSLDNFSIWVTITPESVKIKRLQEELRLIKEVSKSKWWEYWK